MTTVTLLQLKSDFYRFQGEHFSSTATGGSTAKITDSAMIGYTSEVWPSKVEGQQIRVTSGSASGDLRQAAVFTRNTGDIAPNRVFSAAIANAVTYELWGNAINGGQPLTDLFNDVTRSLRPLTDTQVTVVTNQNQYDITTVVQSRRDIREVYLRILDPAGLAPYNKQELRQGLEWDAYDRGGGGTPTVTLDLFSSRTLNAAVETLWVRGETSFTAFTADTSTTDAVYRDWLAWEAVYELCQRKLGSTTADRVRWQTLRDRAERELLRHRARWIPTSPIQISTFP